MKIYLVVLGMFGIFSSALLGVRMEKPGDLSKAALSWSENQSRIFSVRARSLKEALEQLREDNAGSLNNAIEALRNCRLQYKKFAFFLEFFFPDQAYIYNGPSVPEVDPLEDEVIDPAGLQLIEALLLTKNPYQNKGKLVEQAGMLLNSSETFPLLLNGFKMDDKNTLESMHQELVRIMTLYITGYDGPEIKSGIAESREALASIDTVLASGLGNDGYQDSLGFYIKGGKEYLKAHPDFDSFDRLFFITRYAQHIEKYLNLLILETGDGQPNLPVLNLHADNLFSPDALDRNAFPHTENQDDPRILSLGKKLFFEPALSGDGTRSCATCHSPEHFFTDGLARNRTLHGQSDLPRNTPSLLYAGYQYAEFWDGRAQSLEAQIDTVLNSKSEMNSSGAGISKRLIKDPVYAEAYKKIWPADSTIDPDRIKGALAAYIRSLAPFRSDFDRYISGDHAALTPGQQNGFNLFMGKARCGSCHFAPLFNGLLPPDYTSTEFENLGVTADDHFEKPRLDSDLGRYSFFPVPLNKGSFKTPTVRNAAVTSPYMHNGRFSSLERVIEFYDKGGGAGLGLSVPEQTLSADSLHLTVKEKADLVDFIGALTDKVSTSQHQNPDFSFPSEK